MNTQKKLALKMTLHMLALPVVLLRPKTVQLNWMLRIVGLMEQSDLLDGPDPGPSAARMLATLEGWMDKGCPGAARAIRTDPAVWVESRRLLNSPEAGEEYRQFIELHSRLTLLAGDHIQDSEAIYE